MLPRADGIAIRRRGLVRIRTRSPPPPSWTWSCPSPPRACPSSQTRAPGCRTVLEVQSEPELCADLAHLIDIALQAQQGERDGSGDGECGGGGGGAPPGHVEAARAIRDQCAASGFPRTARLLRDTLLPLLDASDPAAKGFMKGNDDGCADGNEGREGASLHPVTLTFRSRRLEASFGAAFISRRRLSHLLTMSFLELCLVAYSFKYYDGLATGVFSLLHFIPALTAIAAVGLRAPLPHAAYFVSTLIFFLFFSMYHHITHVIEHVFRRL
jgi:hypothetical protein